MISPPFRIGQVLDNCFTYLLQYLRTDNTVARIPYLSTVLDGPMTHRNLQYNQLNSEPCNMPEKVSMIQAKGGDRR